MRLARSEIARAHGQAAKAAAIANPYVEFMNWYLSPMHPKPDICDGIQANNPHPVDSAPVPVADSHPQCICCISPQVSRTPAQVTSELREALADARRLYLQPHFTPLQADQFIRRLVAV